MQSNNKVCWGCRSVVHYLWDCPTKRECPVCGKGLVKLMKVIHIKESMGRLFYSCTVEHCKYFQWANVLKPKETDMQNALPTLDMNIDIKLSEDKDLSKEENQQIRHDLKLFLQPLREKLLQFEQQLKDR